MDVIIHGTAGLYGVPERVLGPRDRHTYDDRQGGKLMGKEQKIVTVDLSQGRHQDEMTAKESYSMGTV